MIYVHKYSYINTRESIDFGIFIENYIYINDKEIPFMFNVVSLYVFMLYHGHDIWFWKAYIFFSFIGFYFYFWIVKVHAFIISDKFAI